MGKATADSVCRVPQKKRRWRTAAGGCMVVVYTPAPLMQIQFGVASPTRAGGVSNSRMARERFERAAQTRWRRRAEFMRRICEGACD